MMKIELRRTDSQSGAIYIDGIYICDTEENPRTALPAGEYRVIRHHCKQYGRFMPVVVAMSDEQQVLNPTPSCAHCRQLPEEVYLNTTMPTVCPMLKPGNGVCHRADGSIILGTRVIPGSLKHPLKAFEPLAERIRKAISRGHEVTLVIKEVNPQLYEL